MTGILEKHLKDNWHRIAKDHLVPDKMTLMKLGGQSSAEAPMNVAVFAGDEADPGYLVKMNRRPGDFKHVENEFKNLNKIHGPASVIDGCLVPEPVLLSRIDDFTTVLVETFLPGEKISLNNFRELTSLFSKAFAWLKAFYSVTKKDAKRTLNMEIEGDLKWRSDAIHKRLQRIGNINMPISSSQGDFDFDNLLVGKNTIAIVDWEDYKEEGHPFFDAEFFIFNAALYFYKRDTHIKSFDNFFLKGSRTYKLFDHYITDYCRFLGFGKDIFYIVSIMDTISMIQNGYGCHRRVPMQGTDFLDALVNLTAREIG